MTCVWNGLINKLKLRINAYELCEYVKKNNIIVENVIVNEIVLTEQQKKENIERIKNIDNIHNGYDMSTCDPLLILICELYKVNIKHQFLNVIIDYKNTTADRNNTINVFSNRGHFW